MKTFRLLLVSAALSLGLTSQAQTRQDKVNEVPDFVYGQNPDPSLMVHRTEARSKGINGVPQRPDHWNNATLKFFPPIFNQAGPSCMGSSYVGYIFTNETNSLRNADGYLPENQYAIFFNWLLTRGGSSKGTMLRAVGDPNSVVYGGRTYSTKFGYQEWDELDFGWMQGYDKWYHAMHNRITENATFPMDVITEEGREAVKQWVWNHNGDTDFHGGGVCYVTVGASMINGNIKKTAANEAAGVVGKRYVSCWGPSMNHALTIVGYDDRIEFDLDSNGVYGEKDKDEVGAWVVMNSWGDGWENQGWIYVPYKYGAQCDHQKWPWKPEVQYARKNYKPLRTIKIKMDYSDRRGMNLAAGISADTSATAPSMTISFEHFKNVGASYASTTPQTPMLGRWLDGYHHEPMEFGYDLTDLSASYDRSKPLKYFFIINTRFISQNRTTEADSGHVYSCSLMDYEFDKYGIELPFITETVDVPGGGQVTMLSVIVNGENIGKPTNLQIDGNTLTWQPAQDGSFIVEKYYIQADGVVIDSVAKDVNTYSVTDGSAANYTVVAKCVSGDVVRLSEPTNSVRNYTPVIPSGDNQVASFNGGGFSCPNVISRRLNEATIEFWLKPTSTFNYNQDIGPGWGTFYMHSTSGSGIYYGWQSSSTDRATTNSILTLNTWQHVAVTIDGPVMSLYINGVRKSTFTSKNYAGLAEISNFIFGREYGLNGEIDEVRIWSKARSNAELLRNYMLEVVNPAAQADLLAYYKMDLIDYNGQKMLRDCAKGHHAYLTNVDNMSTKVDNSFLKTTDEFRKAGFRYENRQYYAGDAIEFIPSGDMNTTAEWIWNVPDADVENLKLNRPTIVFPKEGTYDVTLTVKDLYGNVTDSTRTVEILPLSHEDVIADFDIVKADLPVGDHFSFINRSKGKGLTYEWSMPGAEVEKVTTVNAGAVYEEIGEYDVTLKVTSKAGTKQVTKKVTTRNIAPAIAFKVQPYSVVKGEPVFFEDESRYKPTSWTWEITNSKTHVVLIDNKGVDGHSKTSYQDLAPGYYNVTLNASNEVGRSSLTEPSVFVVTNANSFNGLQFQSPGELLTIKDALPATTRVFTIEWWMRPAELANAITMTNKEGDFTFQSTATGALTVKHGNKTSTSDDGFIIKGEWHHYAIVYSIGKVSYYRDGNLVNNNTTSLGITGVNLKGDFVIGNSTEGSHCIIDEFRVWNKMMSLEQIREVCNSPIEDIDAAETNLKLQVYMNFNHSGGDAVDLSSNKRNGVRSGFGPDGDAWVSSLGVFSLNFGDELVATDITEGLMYNYKKPFITTGKSVNFNGPNRFKELETGTARSPWVMKNYIVTDTVTTSVHIDVQKTNELTVETEWSSFASPLYNHLLYQTVELPEGYYRFSITHDRTDSKDPQVSYLVATLGDSLCDMKGIEQTLAAEMIAKSLSITFPMDQAGKVSLGVIYNMSGKVSYSIASFKIEKLDVVVKDVNQAEGIGSLIDQGLIDRVRGMSGGVRVYYDDVTAVKIHDLEGRCVFNEFVSGNKFIPLRPGAYIVNGTKVVVTR